MPIVRRRTTRRRKGRKQSRRIRQRGGADVSKTSTLFDQAFTITLANKVPEKYGKRGTHMKEMAQQASIPLKLWDGTMISRADQYELPKKGVGSLLFKDRNGDSRNLGAIGCFLGHRSLWIHVKDTFPSSLGTLIFEDDVDIPPDFYEQLAKIEKQVAQSAPDWDILFLSKMNVDMGSTKKVSESLYKLPKEMDAERSWGMWSYIIKNSSIESKVLPTVEHMIDGIDMQINKFGDKLNLYLVHPYIIHGHPIAGDSTITAQDNQA